MFKNNVIDRLIGRQPDHGPANAGKKLRDTKLIYTFK